MRPGKKCRVGHQIVFANNILEAEIIKILSNGNRIVQFKYEGIWQEILAELGEMPLPPYITEKLVDKIVIKQFTLNMMAHLQLQLQDFTLLKKF